MKKIFLLFATVSVLFACDPVQEDIKMGDHITAEQLKEMTTVVLDKNAKGENGNVLTCTTSAPVVASWHAGGKDLPGNYVVKKLKLGEQVITLTGLCGDGTVLTVDFPVDVQAITNPLEKYYVYDGDDFVAEQSGDGGQLRFSDNEGKHFPYIKDEVYQGNKTLVFEIKDVQASDGGIWGEGPGMPMLRIMTGWWSPTFADEVEIAETGLWELPITDEISDACRSSKTGGEGKDLTLLLRRGTITFGKVYYEE